MDKLVLISGRSHPELARSVASGLGLELLSTDIRTFANGEIYTRFNSSVRGKNVFIIQTHTAPVNDWIVELLLLIDSCKRASASHITAVCPCYPYARQDKKGYGREPISARLIADLIHCAGADRIISVDLHTSQIQGFFNGPVDHLTAAPTLLSFVRQRLDLDQLTVVSPDIGRVRVADVWSDSLRAPLAIIHKRRDPRVPNEVSVHEIVGEVRGRVCLLVDDLIDTGGTILKAAKALKDNGASQVIVAATHPVFSPPAVERLENSGYVDEVVVTDTVPIPPQRRFSRLEVVSVAPLLASAIRQVVLEGSVSEMFGD